MDGQIEKSVKAQRVSELSKVADKIRNDFLSNQIGKTVSVLIEGKQRDGEYFGYTKNYTPVKIQGEVEIGKIVKIELIDTGEDWCIGKI